jgi:cell division transport system ATP-binding protein
MIFFDNVTKRYPSGFEALRGVTLSLKKGDFAFLTGHSGAGKSTLLKLVALLERCTQGQIVVDGANLNRLEQRKIPYLRRRIGMIFQDYRLLFDRNVFDNVAMPLMIAGMEHQDIQRRVRAALDKVGLLTREKAMPITLSGGEQQRVGIARAVVNRPHILLADEPTGNLDPELSQEILRLFEQFNQVGVTVLVATHDHSLIEHFPHRTLTLKNGHLSEAGATLS